MKQIKSALLLIPLLLLTACDGGGPGEFDRMLGGMMSGGGSARTVPAPTQPNLPGTAGTKMLTDPEGTVSDEGLEVKALNETEAFNQCQDIAASRSSPDTIVTCLGCRRRTITTDKFMCTVRIEYVQLPQRPQ